MFSTTAGLFTLKQDTTKLLGANGAFVWDYIQLWINTHLLHQQVSQQQEGVCQINRK